MSQQVFLLLPVHNRKEVTSELIQCLLHQTYQNYSLVLIDDGSTDGTAEMVSQAIPGVVVIRGAGDWWWGGSLQRGFDWLTQVDPDEESVVLIMNDDTKFGADFLKAGVDALRRNPRSLLLSRIHDETSGQVVESAVHADLRKLVFRVARNSEEINCLSTRGLFLSWGHMKKIGGFHPRLLPHYWSDYEYSIRAHRKGFACVTDPEVVLTPDWSITGNRNVEHLSGWKFIQTLFSRKTIANPIYKTAFVVLAVPGRWMFPNIIRIWSRVLVDVVSKGVVRPLLVLFRLGP